MVLRTRSSQKRSQPIRSPSLTDKAESSPSPARQRARDIPGLGEPYQRARRQYGLWSGLLLAWEFVGLEVNQVPIPNLDVAIRTPSAIPYVLIALVFYFGARTAVEWHQCDDRRRALHPSRVDFGMAHALALSALGLYSVQRLLELQLA